MPIRLTGLASGLDTETIISALVSSYNYKTQKYKKAQTKLSWKQDAWKSLNTKIYSLYTSLDGLRFSKNYNLKTTTCSDTTKATVKSTNNAVNGTQKLNVLKTAQAGYLTGGKLASSTTSSTTLAELGYTGGDGKIDVNLGNGTRRTITVSQGSTMQQVINSLKDAGVNASYDETNKRIYVSSKETGVANDFTLTGANTDGLAALGKLGLCVGSSATQATYQAYTQYDGADNATIEANIRAGVAAYADAVQNNKVAQAQNSNLTAAYGYASAYSAMRNMLGSSSLSADQQNQFKKLLEVSAATRLESVVDASGNIYNKEHVDADESTIYSKDGTYYKEVITYKDSSSNVYTKLDDGTYKNSSGDIFTATSERDSNGNLYYEHTESDGSVTKVAITRNSDFYEASATEVGTGLYKYTDGSGVTYTENAVLGIYEGSDGKKYQLNADGVTMEEYDLNAGAVVSGGATATVGPREEITRTEYAQGAPTSAVKNSSKMYEELKTASGLTANQINDLTTNVGKVKAFESGSNGVLQNSDPYSRQSIAAAIENAYNNNGGAAGVTAESNTFATVIDENNKKISGYDTPSGTHVDGYQEIIDKHSVLANIASMTPGSTQQQNAINSFVDQVVAARNNLAYMNANSNSDASKIDGRDAEIKLNGILYTGSSNAFSINGLTITAQSETGDGDNNALTITTQTDTQGMYDKIKDFLTQYNSVINEITSMYNAPSAKGYEPLTDEEKDAMTDTEIEKWEDKIKSAVLRRDDSLQSIMSVMTSAMSKGVEVNGKKYYLSSFGIKTLGYLNAAENEQNAFHIDGDEDDASVSGNTDKLMKALTEEPDTVIQFMQGLVNNLHTEMGKKMQSSTLSSVFKVYNDKEMASEYSDYTSIIKKWEDKLSAQEDYYYKKFSAMETALSKLQSQTSSMSNLFGG